MSLGVIAVVDAKPEHRSRVLNALQAVLAPSRAEAGCLQYDLHVATDNADRLVMVERWRDAAALEEHLATPHFAALKQTIDGAVDSLTITRLNPIS